MDDSTPTFQTEVLDTSKALPVVVALWAPWRVLTPILEKVARDCEGRVKFVKVNSDECPDISQACAVRSIPNVIAFRDGNPATRFMGMIPEGEVRKFFDAPLPNPSELALARAEGLFKEGRLDDAEAELGQEKSEPDWDARV